MRMENDTYVLGEMTAHV